MKTYKHILAAVDFSASCDDAVEMAGKLADVFQAKLNIVHFVEPLPAMVYSYVKVEEVEEEIHAQAQAALQKWATQHDIDPKEVELISAYAKSGVVEYAKEIGADLIVVGSHGHKGVLHQLLGSTANSVVHHADCDVFIVRAK